MKIITAPHPTLRQPAQVDKKLRIFITQLAQDGSVEEETDLVIRHFINPVITKHSSQVIFGEEQNDDDPRLEGCLSIPRIYAPVPRWQWIQLDYYVIENDKLVFRSERMENF